MDFVLLFVDVMGIEPITNALQVHFASQWTCTPKKKALIFISGLLIFLFILTNK
jgi:hypothetical protein